MIDPGQANQGDESFDASNEDDLDINFASRWQASKQLATFLGTLHKPLSVFERKTISCKFPRPDVDAIYTPMPDAYLSSLVPEREQILARPVPGFTGSIEPHV